MDSENQTFYARQMEEAKKLGSAEKDFYSAGVNAKKWATDNGLMPIEDEYGELQYTSEQAFKAACHGREDICATLLIQMPILKRLDLIKNLLWACVFALAYIGYKVS